MRIVRISQPTSQVGIDRGHPLARGLSLAYCPYITTNAAHPSLTPRFRVSAMSGITYGMGQRGRYFTPSGATNDRVAFGNADGTAVQVITSNTDWTIAILAAPTNSAVTTAMFSQRSSTGNVEQIDLMRGRNGLLSADQRTYQVYYRDTSGNPYYADNASVFANPIDGFMHLYGGSCQTLPAGTLQLDIWRDGINVTERRTTPTGTFVSTAQTTWLGNLGGYTSDGAFAATCPMSLVLVWGARALSPVEWLQLAANPWQVFAPMERQLYVPSASVGGGFQAAWARAANTVISAGARAA